MTRRVLFYRSILLNITLSLMALSFTSSIHSDVDQGKSVEKPFMVAAISEGFDAERTYRAACFSCHNSGAAGAPRLTDTAAWVGITEKGMDAVLRNVIRGINAMPAKGLCFNCTDDDLRAVVQYMFDSSRNQ